MWLEYVKGFLLFWSPLERLICSSELNSVGVAIPEEFLKNLLKNYVRPKKDYTYLTIVIAGYLRTGATFESYILTPSLVKSNQRNEVFWLRNEYSFSLQ